MSFFSCTVFHSILCRDFLNLFVRSIITHNLRHDYCKFLISLTESFSVLHHFFCWDKIGRPFFDARQKFSVFLRFLKYEFLKDLFFRPLFLAITKTKLAVKMSFACALSEKKWEVVFRIVSNFGFWQGQLWIYFAYCIYCFQIKSRLWNTFAADMNFYYINHLDFEIISRKISVPFFLKHTLGLQFSFSFFFLPEWILARTCLAGGRGCL